MGKTPPLLLAVAGGARRIPEREVEIEGGGGEEEGRRMVWEGREARVCENERVNLYI